MLQRTHYRLFTLNPFLPSLWEEQAVRESPRKRTLGGFTVVQNGGENECPDPSFYIFLLSYD